jgi:hypothetical protein
MALKTYYMGVSGRGVGKIFGMSKANVCNWIKKMVEELLKSGKPGPIFELDELYWFIKICLCSFASPATSASLCTIFAKSAFLYWIFFRSANGHTANEKKLDKLQNPCYV